MLYIYILFAEQVVKVRKFSKKNRVDTTTDDDDDEALVKTKAPWIIKKSIRPSVEASVEASVEKKKRAPNPNYSKYAFRKIWNRDFFQLNPFPHKSTCNPFAETEKKLKRSEMLNTAQMQYEKQCLELYSSYCDAVGTINSRFDRCYSDATNSKY